MKDVVLKGKTINCTDLDKSLRELLGKYEIKRIAYISFFEYANQLHTRIGYFNPYTGLIKELHLKNEDQEELLLDLEDIFTHV